MELSVLFTGLVLGGVIGAFIAWLLAINKFRAEKWIDKMELEKNYVSKETYQHLELYFKKNEVELKDKIEVINVLREKLAAREEMVKQFHQKVQEGNKQVEKMEERFRAEFKSLANDILDEKSKKFLEINNGRLGEILNPFQDRLNEFKDKVEKTYQAEAREIITLKEQIKHLHQANTKVGEDAQRLANALQGDSKVQGDWGEMQLELILEKAGLIKGVHFLKQEVLKNDAGNVLRPDYIVKLPEDKYIVIDSKVSLTAYNRYFNEIDQAEKQLYLQEHLKSVMQHIKDLGSKNYQQLNQLNQPDYVMLFMPIEPALTLAFREDPSIFDKALDKNVVMVAPSTLLATLRTVAFIWKQDSQKKNVLEIARESGALYDKFTGFMDDMGKIESSIEKLHITYESAINKLYKSKKKGDTIVGRIERIRELGADASKKLSDHVINRIEDGEKGS
ncbi:DNA recombination protein RmuC [Flammeovirgaceae bacterium SG7u.111]|nr:DNA recombination protein RmuC [Flammeovirgaceae bacterium SG7u.132]WPO37467.1 DNA recombination protein RmuC [Flammeovirgaceae bacterium SG7u.111]